MKIDEEIISYVRKHFPYTPTRVVADYLNLTISKIRAIANRYDIKKDEEILKEVEKGPGRTQTEMV